MKETGYMEVLDDGKEPEGPHPVGTSGKNFSSKKIKIFCSGKKIRSIQKHRDYDFTLIESIVPKEGKRCVKRKLRFQVCKKNDTLR